REAALHLGGQVAGLGQVEGAAGDEQDVVGPDRTVLGAHGTALDQRQQAALHALAAAVGAHALAALGDLVDLVEQDDAVLPAGLDRGFAHLVLVDQPASFLLDEHWPRGPDAHGLAVGLAAGELREHLSQLLAHLLHAGRRHDVDADVHGDVEFDLALIQFAG